MQALSCKLFYLYSSSSIFTCFQLFIFIFYFEFLRVFQGFQGFSGFSGFSGFLRVTRVSHRKLTFSLGVSMIPTPPFPRAVIPTMQLLFYTSSPFGRYGRVDWRWLVLKIAVWTHLDALRPMNRLVIAERRQCHVIPATSPLAMSALHVGYHVIRHVSTSCQVDFLRVQSSRFLILFFFPRLLGFLRVFQGCSGFRVTWVFLSISAFFF